MRGLPAVLATLLLSACTVFGVRSGTEEPAHTVDQTLDGDVEIRTYGPRVAAEAVVDAPDEDAGRNAAFRALFDYISGANRVQKTIAMTAPVQVDDEQRDRGSQAIAMTVPVQTGPVGEGRYAMRFFLPSSFTLVTAPAPTDPRIRLLAVPEETVAVLRFSGSRSDAALGERKAELLRVLDGSPWQPEGVPTAWLYDPPWTIAALRRNEVVVRVAARQEMAN